MTSDQKNAATFPAVAAGLAGALCYATWSVCREAEKEAKEDASLLLGFAMGLLLFSLFPKEWLGLKHVVTSDTTSIIGVVIGGALAGMAYWAMSRATESFPGPTVLLIGSAEAPLATLWVWLFLGREFGLLALLGALLSLAATILYGLHVMRIEQKV